MPSASSRTNAHSTAAALEARRASGAASREHLLDVAERLFAERSIDGVSIRAINQAAGFGPTAVHYHFGSKDELLTALVHRRFSLIMARQTELLARVEVGPIPTTEQLVAVIAGPFFDAVRAAPTEGAQWLLLATRLVQDNHPALVRRNRTSRFEERLMDQIRRRYPDKSVEFLVPRWRMTILALMALISGSREEFAPELLIRFSARGFDGLCLDG